MSRRDKANLQADLMMLIPKAAKRVKVRTEKGNTKYKDIADVAYNDVIIVNVKGIPIVMRSAPGRKSKVDPQPANAAVKELVKRKTAAILEDELRLAAKNDPDSDVVLRNVMLGLTEEVASLCFERHEAERLGKDTSQISVRRIGGLKAVAETWLKRKDQIANKSVDLSSPGWKASMSHVLETMKEAMLSMGMRPEMVQTVFAKFSTITSTASWEAELKTRVKSA